MSDDFRGATAFAQIVCYGQYGRPYPSKQLGFLFHIGTYIDNSPLDFVSGSYRRSGLI